MLNFGNVTAGTTKTLSVTATNSGTKSLTISSAAVSTKYFSISSPTLPVTVAPGVSATLSVSFTPNAAGSFSATTLNASQSTTFTVGFAPQTAGNAIGSVTISSNANNPTLLMQLTGTGATTAAQLTVSPSTLGLGNVVVGTSGTASGSLTASGGSVTVTAATTNNSVFSIGGFSLPLTINSGQSIPFTITFSPATTGGVSASLTVASSAQPSTSTEALTGTGTPAPVHTVNLSWNGSSSSNISGYNVYRSVYQSSCGGYAKINAVLNTTTLYTDNSVVDGTSYCYAATAVNTSNQESAYSNIVTNVQIPAP